MATASEAEYRQFHNARLADRLRASQLLDARFGAKSNAKEQSNAPDTNTTNGDSNSQRQPRTSANTKNTSTSSTVQIKKLKKELKKTDVDIAKKHSELGQFYKMLFSQWIPVSATGGATFFEILDGGLISLVVTGFAILIRFMWFFMQSPKVKFWLRTKQMVQAAIMSAISLIPFVGVLLQPDLISTAVITPVATWKKIQSIKSELNKEKGHKEQLERKIKSIQLAA